MNFEAEVISYYFNRRGTTEVRLIYNPSVKAYQVYSSCGGGFSKSSRTDFELFEYAWRCFYTVCRTEHTTPLPSETGRLRALKKAKDLGLLDNAEYRRLRADKWG